MCFINVGGMPWVSFFYIFLYISYLCWHREEGRKAGFLLVIDFLFTESLQLL